MELGLTKEQLSAVISKHLEREVVLQDLLEIMLESMMVAERGEILSEGTDGNKDTVFLIIGKLELFGLGNLLRKFLAKIVHKTENFCNFIPVSHKQKFCIWLSLNTLKIQTFAYFSKFLMRNSRYFKFVALKPLNALLIIGKGLMTDELAPKNAFCATILENNYAKITAPVCCIHQ